MAVIGRMRIGYDGSPNGMVVEFDGDTSKFLAANGAFSAPVTVIADGSVTLAKLADLATDKIIGRVSGGTGVPEAVTFTDQAQQLADDTSFGAMFTTMGVSGFVQTIFDDADAAAVRATIGAGTGSGSGDALTTQPLSQFAATTSAQLRGVLSDETGTGVAYFQGGDAGTPSAIVLTNATGTAAGLTAGNATLASTVTVVDSAGDTTTNVVLTGSATGSLPLLTDPGLTYDAATNALTATTFVGALTGNAATATLAAVAVVSATATIADAAGDTTTNVLLAGAATGDLPLLTDPGLTYNATTNALTATTFIGALTGVASGNQLSDTQLTSLAALAYAGNSLKVVRVNVGETDFELATAGAGDALTSGHLGQFAATTSAQLRTVLSDETGTGVAYFQGGDAGTPSAIVLTNATGTAASLTAGVATLASTVTVADAAADTTTFLMLAGAATGSLPVLTDAGLSFNANTNVLTVSGSVAANVTGNLTGNADTVTVSDAGADTTTFPLLATDATGSLGPRTDAGITYNANTNALTTTTFVGALTGTASGNVVLNSSTRRFIQTQYIAQGTTSFVPHASATFWIIEGVGAGGGGGGCTDAATNGIGAGGGGGGAWARVTSTSVANPTACVVGLGGTAGTAGNTGGTGTDTTFGAILVAKGGVGGLGGTVGAAGQNIKLGGAGGALASCTGDEMTSGQPGGTGFALVAALAVSGVGGSSVWGGGANGRAGQGDGVTATGWGGGGSGGAIISSGGDQIGGAGANGRLRVFEYATA